MPDMTQVTVNRAVDGLMHCPVDGCPVCHLNGDTLKVRRPRPPILNSSSANRLLQEHVSLDHPPFFQQLTASASPPSATAPPPRTSARTSASLRAVEHVADPGRPQRGPDRTTEPPHAQASTSHAALAMEKERTPLPEETTDDQAQGVPITYSTADRGAPAHPFCPCRRSDLLADTLTSDSLNSLGLLINSVHRTLICGSCHVSINHLEVVQHLTGKQHPFVKGQRGLQQLVDEQVAYMLPQGLIYPPVTPLAEVNAVFGLTAPVAGYRRCCDCRKWFKGTAKPGASTSFQKHQCPSRSNVPAANPMAPDSIVTLAAVQRFSKTPGADWFPVRIVVPPPPVLSPLEQFNQQCAQQRAADPQLPAVSENHRVFHQFLRKERWIAHLEPYSPIDLDVLHQITLLDPQFPRLARHIEFYMLELQDDLPNYLTRRIIGKRPGTE